MSTVLDKASLLLAAIACAAAAWAILHYSGEWFFPAVTLIALISLYLDNRRLRSILKEHGISASKK